jgi:hypothetical protein
MTSTPEEVEEVEVEEVEEVEEKTARAGLWPKLVTQSPAVGEHQGKTTRQIPVFMLIRHD